MEVEVVEEGETGGMVRWRWWWRRKRSETDRERERNGEKLVVEGGNGMIWRKR